MTFNSMPPIYEAQAKSEAERVIQLGESAHHLQAGEYAKKAAQIRSKMPANNFTGKDALIGFLITWVLEAFLVRIIFELVDVGDAEVPLMLLFWVIGTVVIGLWVNRAKRKRIAGKLAALEKEMEEKRDKLSASHVAVRQEAAEESAAYRVAFEEEARKMSLRFAESQLVDQVVDWAMKQIVPVIGSANRAPHIEQVDIAAALAVAPHAISCSAIESISTNPNGTNHSVSVFDFEENRCRNLTGPLEQAALAHALGSKLQVALMLQYTQDPSGSVPSVTFLESYMDNNVNVNVRYLAANLNYQAVKNW